MKSIFKKVAVIAIAVMAVSMVANAQEVGDKAVGGSLVLGSGNNYTNYGIGARFLYNVTSPIRLDGSFTYFLEKDYLSMWDLSVNAHWLFPVADKTTVYPLAGLGILGSSVNIPKIEVGGFSTGGGNISSSDLALNLGGGIDQKLTDVLTFNAELKYKVVDNMNRFLISAGIIYKF
jgi:outer membrane protein X